MQTLEAVYPPDSEIWPLPEMGASQTLRRLEREVSEFIVSRRIFRLEEALGVVRGRCSLVRAA